MAELLRDLKDQMTHKASDLKAKVQSKKSGSSTDEPEDTSAPAFERTSTTTTDGMGTAATTSGMDATKTTTADKYNEPLPHFDANPGTSAGITEMEPQGLASNAPEGVRRELDPTLGESTGVQPGHEMASRGAPPSGGFGTASGTSGTGVGTDGAEGEAAFLPSTGELKDQAAHLHHASTGPADLRGNDESTATGGTAPTSGGDAPTEGEAAFLPSTGELKDQAAHLHHASTGPSDLKGNEFNASSTSGQHFGGGDSRGVGGFEQQGTSGQDLGTSGQTGDSDLGATLGQSGGVGGGTDTSGGTSGMGFGDTTSGQQQTTSGGAGNMGEISGSDAPQRDIKEVLDRLDTTDQTGFYLKK